MGFSAWRSVGLVGGLLRLAQRWDPLPGEVPGPLAWGSEERLRQEVEPFGGEESDFHLATLEMRFADQQEAARRLLRAFAPLAAAHDALPAGEAEELRAQVAALVAQWAEPGPDGIVLRARYIVALARRPGRPPPRSNARSARRAAGHAAGIDAPGVLDEGQVQPARAPVDAGLLDEADVDVDVGLVVLPEAQRELDDLDALEVGAPLLVLGQRGARSELLADKVVGLLEATLSHACVEEPHGVLGVRDPRLVRRRRRFPARSRHRLGAVAFAAAGQK